MASTTAGRSRTYLLAAALLCALTVPGCGGPGDPADAPEGSAGPARPTAAAAAEGRFDATAIGWMQLMIALDDQARHLLALAPDRSADPGLGRWAAGLAEGKGRELRTLRALLAETGVPDDNPHEGHDMPGMVDARELAALRAAEGPRFDRLLCSALREHLLQTRKLAASMGAADADRAVRDAALAAGDSAAEALRRMPAA
ncbi:DUF305 domain-containing protein [Streptomyces sp. NPDC058739]|uniref:DUF305 domain-containing protein n=1 Tax=Streptomyces sp. NPDC058739 TaxID=3346618 RepID=UPI00369D89D9